MLHWYWTRWPNAGSCTSSNRSSEGQAEGDYFYIFSLYENATFAVRKVAYRTILSFTMNLYSLRSFNIFTRLFSFENTYTHFYLTKRWFRSRMKTNHFMFYVVKRMFTVLSGTNNNSIPYVLPSFNLKILKMYFHRDWTHLTVAIFQDNIQYNIAYVYTKWPIIDLTELLSIERISMLLPRCWQMWNLQIQHFSKLVFVEL